VSQGVHCRACHRAGTSEGALPQLLLLYLLLLLLLMMVVLGLQAEASSLAFPRSWGLQEAVLGLCWELHGQLAAMYCRAAQSPAAHVSVCCMCRF